MSRRRGLRVFAAAALAAWASASAARAADVELRAYVEPSGRVTDAQTVRLVIEAEGTEVPELTVPRLPSLTNLELVGGPSTAQSSMLQYDGTRARQAITRQLVYALVPEGPGPAEIPAIEVRLGGETRRTEPIRFEVVRGDSGRPGPTPGATDDAVPVFLQTDVGRDEVWVGEAVGLDVTLFAGTQVNSLDFIEQPSFANFWVEDDSVDSRAEAYRTTVAGRLYTAYPLVRKVLVPATPGEFTLTPYAAQVGTSRSTGDPFRDLLRGGRTRTVVRRTEPVRLRVRPLPEPDDPEAFTGAVGTFRMVTTLDREIARVNDAVGITATVEGEGLLRSVPAPSLGGTDDLKVFDPKVTESSRIRDGKLLSRKQWEWIVVPLTPGELRVPMPAFTYFDPRSGTYERLTGPDRTLVVQRGDAPPDEGIARGDVRLQRREIAFIKPLRGRLGERAPRVHRRTWFLVALVVPWVLSAAIIVAGRQRARFLRDHGLARARRARTRARKRLRAARRLLDRTDAAAFYEEVARAVVEYVADRFDRSPSGLSYDLADDLLASRGVDTDLRGRVRSCLETCDFARYVSGSAGGERREEVHREASEIVESLEKALS